MDIAKFESILYPILPISLSYKNLYGLRMVCLYAKESEDYSFVLTSYTLNFLIKITTKKRISIAFLIFGIEMIGMLSVGANVFAKSADNKECFHLGYKQGRESAEKKGFNDTTQDADISKNVLLACAELIAKFQSNKKFARDVETTSEFTGIIAETPGGLSRFLLSPQTMPSEIITGITLSKINAMDAFINPVNNIRTNCINGNLAMSWKRVWGEEVPSKDILNSISVFCDSLTIQYNDVMKASSIHLRSIMNMKEKEYISELDKMRTECDIMRTGGVISKSRARYIRNEQVARELDLFAMQYDPYKPDGGGLVSNNSLQSSLIGSDVISQSLTSLNIAADSARQSCAQVIINF